MTPFVQPIQPPGRCVDRRTRLGLQRNQRSSSDEIVRAVNDDCDRFHGYCVYVGLQLIYCRRRQRCTSSTECSILAAAAAPTPPRARTRDLHADRYGSLTQLTLYIRYSAQKLSHVDDKSRLQGQRAPPYIIRSCRERAFEAAGLEKAVQ